MNVRSILRGSAALALVTTLLTGCIVAPVGPPRGAVVVSVALPAPTVEVYGRPPAMGYIWIGGFWNWVGNRHVWVPGHWDAPRPGYRWAPHRWAPVGGGWRLDPGHWEREGR